MNLLKRILILASLVILVACNKERSWNQKLTVAVQTPNGVVQGSSVTTVIKAQNNAFWVPHEARGVRSSVRGEAVVVEVAPDKYLFVLLDGMNEIAQKAFPDLMRANRGFPNWAEAIAGHREVGIVPPEHYPTMVMFEDIADPTSMKIVDPSNLETVFGSAVELNSVELSIETERGRSMVVEQFVPWLAPIGRTQSNLVGKPENGLISNQPNPKRFLITPLYFSTELFK